MPTTTLLAACLLGLGLLIPRPAAAADDDIRLIAHTGDDLDTMLQRITGDAGAVAKIREHNGLAADAAPAPGQSILVPRAWAAELGASEAEVLFVRGEVAIRSAAGASLPAGVGARLRAGDTLTTGDGAAASLRLVGADDSEVHDHLFVDANAELRVDQLFVTADRSLRSAILELLRGAVEAITAPSGETRTLIEVETPTAIGGVRGAEFRVVVEPPADDAPVATRVETLTGTVATAAQGAGVAVEAGFGNRTRAGEAPGEPRALPPTPPPIAPADGAELSAFRFAWGAVHAVRGYRIEIAEDDAFVQVVYAEDESGAIHEPAVAALPDTREPLYWRVSTIDMDGFRSAPSEARSFTIAR